MLALEEFEKAKRYASMATSVNRHNFTARYTQFFIAGIDLEEYQPNIDTSSFTGTLLTAGWAMARTSGKKGGVTTAARNLVEAFRQKTKAPESADVDEWIDCSEDLLTVGDSLNAYGISNAFVYRAILDAPWDQVDQGSHSPKVVELRNKATGLLRL
jgi:hypothetical protein